MALGVRLVRSPQVQQAFVASMKMSKDSQPEPNAVEIPPDALQPETLRAVIEELVTREGTDYGLHEKDLEQKIADVRRQLQRGEAVIVFDADTGTVNIILKRERPLSLA